MPRREYDCKAVVLVGVPEVYQVQHCQGEGEVWVSSCFWPPPSLPCARLQAASLRGGRRARELERLAVVVEPAALLLIPAVACGRAPSRALVPGEASSDEGRLDRLSTSLAGGDVSKTAVFEPRDGIRTAVGHAFWPSHPAVCGTKGPLAGALSRGGTFSPRF